MIIVDALFLEGDIYEGLWRKTREEGRKKGYQEEERKIMGSLIHMHPGGSTDLAPF